MDKNTLAVVITIAFSLVGVLGDYFLKLASEFERHLHLVFVYYWRSRVLADIEASPRGLLEILSSISDYPRNRRFLPAGHNRERASLATRSPAFPGQKCEQLLRFG